MLQSILVLIALNFFLLGRSQILKKEIPDKLVVLTFDDAPASQYAVVAPLLELPFLYVNFPQIIRTVPCI